MSDTDGDQDRIADEIRALEERLLDPEVRASAAELDRLVSDDFREFGKSGRIYTKEDAIRLLVANPAGPSDLSEFMAAVIAPGVVLATFRTGGEVRSSVWRVEGGRWRLYFHQATREGDGDRIAERA